MQFKFEGGTFQLTSDMIHRALAGQMPSGIHRYWVEVGGVRWPVKEAVSLSTGLARTRFQSQHAQRWLKKLGFSVHDTGTPGRLEEAISAEVPTASQLGASTLVPLSTSEISVQFSWLRAGELSLDSAMLPVFPPLPAGPALYRFDFGVDEEGIRALYIGESSSIRRRASNYRNAKTDRTRQRTSRRIHKEVVAHLANGGSIEFAIATEVMVNGAKTELRLRSSRRLAENAAVLLAQMTNDITVLNVDEDLTLADDLANAAVR